MLIASLTFGLAVGFMLIGLIGVLVPMVPGTLLIWLTLLVYSLVDGFNAITPPLFLVFTVFAAIIGTADLWLPLLGARVTGSAGSSMLYGVGGGLAGFLAFNLPGALLGYAAGVVLGEYRRRGDWRQALRSSVGGLAGMGVSTLVQVGGSVVLVVAFILFVLMA